MRRFAAVVGLLCVGSLGLGAAFVLAGSVNLRQHNGITICHESGSGKFEEITVDADSILGGHGHGGHEDDIIPPFEVIENGSVEHYPGMNIDTLYGDGFTGAEVLANHCDIPTSTGEITGSTETVTVTVPVTTTETVTKPGTTVTLPGETTTTEITVTETLPADTVTAPGETTTVTVPSVETTTVTVPNETVTVPPVTETAPGETVTTPTITVTAPGETVTLPGETVTAPGETITLPPVTVTAPGETVTRPPDTVTEPGQTVVRDPVTVTEPGTTETITGGTTTTVITVTVPDHPYTEGGLRDKLRDVVTVTTPGRVDHLPPHPVRAVIKYLTRVEKITVTVVRIATPHSGVGRG